ncbi:SUF system NifU family Fe-S cluster assembly protein [Arthrobacter sp. EH-1B-1]|uniref:SUF system NifU family Fe-S cluster assembly protein n=1 Tax=Arthrobacter vasquezii TaxID=2977629 RepID=A0ABT6CXV8_9MICC|nr:SUF system NifU family Fe-S cluster assembly protein [Arthrobacter vasquezii]MDF9278931.1 SUF system NifU family Fe-S cluster assembly protein [Arthrobacter vasquezii]
MSSELENLYQQIILDHAKRRVGQGSTDPAFGAGSVPEEEPVAGSPATGSLATGASHQLNPICGDELTLRVWIAGSRIERVAWEGAGCAISMASASVLTELVSGETRDDMMEQLDRFRELMRSRGTIVPDEEVLGDAAAFAGVSRFPARVKCAMLAWVALEEAVLAANS